MLALDGSVLWFHQDKGKGRTLFCKMKAGTAPVLLTP